jgi:hypothetical protein
MDGRVILIREVTIHAPRGSDRLSRLLLVVLSFAVAWLLVQPYFGPSRAEAQREAVTVNLERVGGRQLLDGVIPIRCADLRR